MQKIDNILNKFTMYRIVLYGLLFLSGISLILNIFGLLSFKPLNLVISFGLIISVCYVSNKLISMILKIPSNPESFLITSLILFLILLPLDSIDTAVIFVIAGVIAMLSKYLVAINKRHIFNPAAFALVVIGIIGSGQSIWWVGSQYMFIPVLIVGLLVVRKVRKFHLFLSFLIVSIITNLFFAVINNSDPFTALPLIITSYPIIFLGAIMLTEPLTTPPSKKLQIIYGSIVGLFSGLQFAFVPIFSTPELALIVGNIFAYIVSFKYRIELKLKEKIQIAPNIYEFKFTPNHKFSFHAGQFMEWSLGHKKSDSRGIRRYFTISSSPTEDEVMLGVRIDENNSSSFKKSLFNLKIGDKIYGGQLSGDFILPENEAEKIVFIAGGIGITPMRSMIKSVIDQKQKRDIVNFYACSTDLEFVYEDIFKSAEEFGVKTVYVCSKPKSDWVGISGRINSEIIKNEVIDFKNRTYYLSGPNVMVDNYKKLLKELGISKNKIKSDYFPGYA